MSSLKEENNALKAALERHQFAQRQAERGHNEAIQLLEYNNEEILMVKAKVEMELQQEKKERYVERRCYSTMIRKLVAHFEAEYKSMDEAVEGYKGLWVEEVLKAMRKKNKRKERKALKRLQREGA
jgi:hypothetical protein